MSDFSLYIAKQDFTLLRKKEVAKLLRVSESTLYRMVRTGAIPEPSRTPKGYIRGWPAKTLEQWFT
ncbi:helix-turn-helix transcriptional regulator [Vibrio alginolyticus]|uniref:helix-turn-helix transcriptional regulator n=1 Tax=Vibrio alginolyticus TaxID=663 RepID=UPI003C12FE47